VSGFDPGRVIDVLARHDVEFVVIGAFAAELYRAPIPATQDIDVTPRRSEANLVKLSAALHELGARIRTAGVPDGLTFSHDASSLGRADMWNLTTDAGDFDLSFQPTGTGGYDDLAAGALVVDVGGHHVAVASLADVVRSKEAAGRPKDLATVPILRQWDEALSAMSPDDLRAGVLRVLRLRAGLGPTTAETGREGRDYLPVPGSRVTARVRAPRAVPPPPRDQGQR
jgi:hypothetical protein